MKIISFLVFLLLFLNSCEIKRNNLYKHPSTHKLTNDIIFKPIQKYLKEELKDNSIYDVLILQIKDDSKQSKIYFKLSNLRMQKVYFKLKNNQSNLKGFLFVDNLLVLLYGDIDFFFKKIENVPKFTDLEYKNNELLFSVHKTYQCYIYDKLNNKMMYRGITDEI